MQRQLVCEIACVCCVFLSTVDENNELPEDFDEEFFREIHQKGGMLNGILVCAFSLKNYGRLLIGRFSASEAVRFVCNWRFTLHL